MKKDNFASTGGEQFELESQKEEKIVLDIQEEQEVTGVLLDGKVQEDESTGSVVKDAFNKTNKWFIKHSAVKVGDKATFFHLLAVMVNSGIPMIKSLKSLALQIEKSPRLKMIIEEVGAEIEEGSSLSVAMGHYPDVFFEQELGMIKSGEASGQLAKVLQALAHDTEKAYTIRRKVKSAMMYPIIVFLLLLAVISAMMIFVIPELTELFATMKQDLPMITKVVIAISDFMIESKFVLMVAILVMIASFMAFKRTQFGRYTLDKMKISIPVFGPLFKKAFLSRFARRLSNLLDSNVTILKTIEIVANSIGNEVYKKRLLLSLEDIKQGIPLAENLADSDLFPPMLVNMIEVGEQTAQLDTMTAKIADFYESEVDTSVEGLSKILEPIILIVVGLSVGLVVAAIMLPIMKLADVAGSV